MINMFQYGRIKTSVKSEVAVGSRTAVTTHGTDYDSYIYTKVVPSNSNPVVLDVTATGGLYDQTTVSDF